jgi:hypothetical protein
VQLGQHQGVSTIGLHSVSSFHRDQWRRHDDAGRKDGPQWVQDPLCSIR